MLLVQFSLLRVFPSLVFNRNVMRIQPPDSARGQMNFTDLLRILPLVREALVFTGRQLASNASPLFLCDGIVLRAQLPDPALGQQT